MRGLETANRPLETLLLNSYAIGHTSVGPQNLRTEQKTESE